MSEVLTKIVHDCGTGVTAEIPLTGEELAQREIDAKNAETARLEQEAEAQRIEALKVSARAKLTSGQPLTEEEAALLVI